MDQPEPLSELEARELAVFVDTCGTISMKARGQVRLTFRHPDAAMIVKLQAKVGGKVEQAKKPRPSGRWPSTCLVLEGPTVVPLLKAVRPFISFRGPQADAAIEYYERIVPGLRRYSHRTPAQQLAAEAIRARITALNNVGMPPPLAPSEASQIELLIRALQAEATKGGDNK